MVDLDDVRLEIGPFRCIVQLCGNETGDAPAIIEPGLCLNKREQCQR